VAGPPSTIEHARVYAAAIVANAKPELLRGVPDFDFDPLGASVVKCVAQEFTADSVEFVLQNQR
jgi:hypothetical protein